MKDRKRNLYDEIRLTKRGADVLVFSLSLLLLIALTVAFILSNG